MRAFPDSDRQQDRPGAGAGLDTFMGLGAIGQRKFRVRTVGIRHRLDGCDKVVDRRLVAPLFEANPGECLRRKQQSRLPKLQPQ